MRSTRWKVAFVALLGVIVLLVAWIRQTEKRGSSTTTSAVPATPSRLDHDPVAREAEIATSPGREAVEARVEPAAPRSVPPERVLVRGRVVDPRGKALAGAMVLAAAPCEVPQQEWNWIALDGKRPKHCGPVTHAASGADGAFELELERAEELHVAVRCAGFVGLDLERQPGEDTRELDLGELALEVGATLSGRVVDEAGRPVTGAEIARFGLTDFTERYRIDWSDVVLATSAADGGFRIDSLALGPTEIEVRAPGFVRERREVFADGERLPEWRVELEPAARITGRVVGAPAGAELGVYFSLQTQNEQRFVACASDGSFVIDGLSLAQPELALYATKKRSDPSGLLEMLSSPDWQLISPSVRVRPGMRDVELHVPPPVTYRLQLVDAVTGAPLSDGNVALLGGFGSPDARAGEQRVEPSGTYSISALLPQMDYSSALSITHPGHEGAILGQLPFVSGSTHDLGTVSLSPLETTEVRVFGSSREPVAEARVRASIAPSDEWNDIRKNWPARSVLPATWEGRTGQDGTARVQLSSGQRYVLEVEHEAHAPLAVPLAVGVHPPADLELHLLQGGTVLISCLDATRLEPLAGESIAYEQSRGENNWWREVKCETGSDGVVRIEHVTPGLYRFWPEELDPEENAEIAQVADGASVEVKLLRRAQDSVRLHGIVTDHGHPVVGARVETWGFETATDTDGHYQFEDEEPGEQELVVTHPRYGLVSTQEIVLTAPETRIDVELALVALQGVVRDAAGQPLGGAAVYVGVRNPEGSFEVLRATAYGDVLHWTGSGPDGSFSFDGVQPRSGLYLLVEKGSFRTERLGPLVFPLDGSALVLAPMLQRAVELEVIAQGLDPRSFGGGVVAIWRGEEELSLDDREQEAERMKSAEDSSERYRFDRLRPGPWSIELRNLFSFGDTRPLARVEVTLELTGNSPVVLRP